MMRSFAVVLSATTLLLLLSVSILAQDGCPDVEPLDGDACTNGCSYGQELCCEDTGECVSQTECECINGQFDCTVPLLRCPSECPDIPGATLGSIDGGGVCFINEQYLCEYYNVTGDCFDPNEPEITTRCSEFGWNPFVYCEGSIYYDNGILSRNENQPDICPETNQEPKQGTVCGLLNTNFGVRCDYGGEVCCPETGECAATATFECNRNHAQGLVNLRSRWDTTFEQPSIQCDSQCPINSPTSGSQCSISPNFRCEYNNGISTTGGQLEEVTCVCQRSTEWFCAGLEDTPPPSPPSPPNPSLCPATKPEGFVTCAIINNGEQCGYDGQICCASSGECFPATTCTCKSDDVFNFQDSWQCEPTSYNCDGLCPFNEPFVGDSCEVEETIECNYGFGDCPLQSGTPATTCMCLSGLIGSKFQCERNCLLPGLPGGDSDTRAPIEAFSPTHSPSLSIVPSLLPSRMPSKVPSTAVPSALPTPTPQPTPRVRPTTAGDAITSPTSRASRHLLPICLVLPLLITFCL